ncbi:MAG: hypothetical protein ACXACO_11930 [Promethearchaeota archaeon]|jgi:hypothetical protein
MTILKDISAEEWSLEKIKTLSYQELMELYKQLPSADMEEMDGDYDSVMVGFPSEAAEKGGNWWLYDTEKGYWMGKSFTPTFRDGEPRGDGYNRWRIDGKEVHHMRFLTDMVPSLVDRKITFRLKYACYKNDGGIVDMTDEVRRIRKRLYLCTGMADPEKLPPGFFCLEGPAHEYDHSGIWIYGDEIKEHTKITVTMDNFPSSEDLQKKE